MTLSLLLYAAGVAVTYSWCHDVRELRMPTPPGVSDRFRYKVEMFMVVCWPITAIFAAYGIWKLSRK